VRGKYLEVAVEHLLAVQKLHGQQDLAEVEPSVLLVQSAAFFRQSLQVEEKFPARTVVDQEVEVCPALETRVQRDCMQIYP
jgi:hypothetical protein